jgi:hypothetical protein
MDALAASPFALLDAHSSLRLVTDAVHEDDALCLALACRALRDALWARFPARPAGHAHAGKRLRTRDAAVGRLGSSVTADGMLCLRRDDVRGLPEGIGRLVYLTRPGLKTLDLSNNGNLTALPDGLCALAGLEELDLSGCGLRALPEEIGRLLGPIGPIGLAGLKKLDLRCNEELTALPAGLGRLRSLEELDIDGCPCLALEHAINVQGGLPALLAYLRGEAVEGVEELDLSHCGLRALPGEIGVLAGLRTLNLCGNRGLTALPAGLGRLCNLLKGEYELDLAAEGDTASEINEGSPLALNL